MTVATENNVTNPSPSVNSNANVTPLSSLSTSIQQSLSHPYNLRERASTVASSNTNYQLTKYGAKPSSLKRKTTTSSTLKSISASISTNNKSGQRTVSVYATRIGTKRHSVGSSLSTTSLNGTSTTQMLLEKRK